MPRGIFSDAKDRFLALERANPRNADILEKIAALYLLENNTALSRAYYERAIRKKPNTRIAALFSGLITARDVSLAGLTPLMMETSEQAQHLIPAAVSLAFGEFFATAITLLLDRSQSTST